MEVGWCRPVARGEGRGKVGQRVGLCSVRRGGGEHGEGLQGCVQGQGGGCWG